MQELPLSPAHHQAFAGQPKHILLPLKAMACTSWVTGQQLQTSCSAMTTNYSKGIPHTAQEGHLLSVLVTGSSLLHVLGAESSLRHVFRAQTFHNDLPHLLY